MRITDITAETNWTGRTRGDRYGVDRVERITPDPGDKPLYDLVDDRIAELHQQGHICLHADEHPDGTDAIIGYLDIAEDEPGAGSGDLAPDGR